MIMGQGANNLLNQSMYPNQRVSYNIMAPGYNPSASQFAQFGQFPPPMMGFQPPTVDPHAQQLQFQHMQSQLMQQQQQVQIQQLQDQIKEQRQLFEEQEKKLQQ